uniref:uncharacterized protein LOC120342317 n=1 Tax=Styela clava TaxID=7725 RepID=UPI00193A391C|nr:uncharacterized protein LOC120342317 [Styela clava]
MDKVDVDSYDMFNDYLGLSNVVGKNEGSFFLMKSLFDKRDFLLEKVPFVYGVEDSGKRSDSTSFNCSLPTSPETRQTGLLRRNDIALSDVERLFGRGVTLQKREPISMPSFPKPFPACDTDILNRNKSSFVTPLVERSENKSPQMNANSNDAAIHAALDAILYKYNLTHGKPPNFENQPFIKPQAGMRENKSNDWMDIASLTAALAKVAASYDEKVKKFENVEQQPKNSDLNRHQMKNMLPSNVSQPTRYVGCSFCKNNKEVKEWYLSHQLKDPIGRVTCPVLRSYVCPLCDATANNAHTIGHCPLNPDRRNSLPLAIRSKANATGKKKLA